MSLRDDIASAIREAAWNDPHCSFPPGPTMALMYADAVIKLLNDRIDSYDAGFPYCTGCGRPHALGECLR